MRIRCCRERSRGGDFVVSVEARGTERKGIDVKRLADQQKQEHWNFLLKNRTPAAAAPRAPASLHPCAGR
ncbi:hypothetical protein PAHAL_7G116200 [Panicum hallii]|uniref:Uncharacterized protein n=1 Tax=Panicum hallii TaxID=206008 RepID=A0A2T8IBW3_9POAL|nr:hypothetical protein PAHAL_7G116200 [Panicum hallii]